MNVAILGYGSIGKRHAGVLRAFSDLFDIEQVVIYDEFNPPEFFYSTGDYKGLWFITARHLEDIWGYKPELIIICTPPDTHVKLACEVMTEGARLGHRPHILIEKPLALTMGGANSLRACRETHNDRVSVACNLRFHPSVVAFRDALKPGDRITSLSMWMGSWLPDWRPERSLPDQADVIPGVLLDSIHELDLAYYLAGPISNARAFTAKTASLNGLPDVEDVAQMIVKHERGTLTNIHLSYSERIPSRGFRAVVNNVAQPIELTPTNDMYIAQMEYLLTKLRDGERPMNGLDEAAHVLRWALQARAYANV